MRTRSLYTPIAPRCVGQWLPNRRSPVANCGSAANANANRIALIALYTVQFTDLEMSVSLPTFIQ
jgi:hypothetical protein